MTAINRNPDSINEPFDVIVVGGGIYGACTLLEASRRGLRALLIERDDFGGATTWNSLRIVHGGLRYLQHADLGRFRRSVAEQTWWLHNFPDLVEPLSCLMPLYNFGLKRTDVMRAALWANDILAAPVRASVHDRRSAFEAAGLAAGRVIGPAEVTSRFPFVRQQRLRGAAIWTDAIMRNPQRLLIEILRWAVSAGGQALNYMKCVGFQSHQGRVAGVTTTCQLTNQRYEFRATRVINCAGPWAEELTAKDNNVTPKTSHRRFARAFNLILDHPPLSQDALAVTPPDAKDFTLFAVPYGKRFMLGTMHLPPGDSLEPTEEEIAHLLGGFNKATSGPDLTLQHVSQVLAGRLPPTAEGSHVPSKSPRMRPHSPESGLQGVLTVEGVKYTTARHVAVQALKHSLGNRLPSYKTCTRPAPSVLPSLSDPLQPDQLRQWVQSESVQFLDDLLLRRCDQTLCGEVEFTEIKAQLSRLLALPYHSTLPTAHSQITSTEEI